MSRVGGKNYKETVRRICEKIMDDMYMLGYSLVEHKGKKSFKSTILFNIIVDAVLLSDQRVTAKAVELQVGCYFAKAKERVSRQPIYKRQHIIMTYNI
ncbi:hypothetical protein HUJ04_011321 [Dendroctonus ponderosae]|nr:hypothetical protein HUJ04_011321 [Dendroctonus ponderosae]